jgi:DNA-directed RNA polymerase specialized sigma24 family protein
MTSNRAPDGAANSTSEGGASPASLGAALLPHLPYVRRYARALAGSQHGGDAVVRATLEAVVAAPDAFPTDLGARLGLYRMFETFWRAAQAAGPDGGSTDLSAVELPVSEQIVRQRLSPITPLSRRALLLTTMEGFSEAEAAVLLDVSREEVALLVSEARNEIERQTRARVLIIEDEPIIAMDIESIVSEAGHDVAAIAVTREEAVAAAAEHRPSLVLADIQLADNSSGIDAVKDILATYSVPVIFITAFPERLLTGEKPEPAFLITKPFQRDTVKAAMAQALFFHPDTVPA